MLSQRGDVFCRKIQVTLGFHEGPSISLCSLRSAGTKPWLVYGQGRCSSVRVGESAEETVQPSVIKHHKPEQKEPLDVVFELVEWNSAFEKADLHI
jgi:hypothetical protein